MSNNNKKRAKGVAFTSEVLTKKGQFFSYDAISGGVVFLIAVALLYSYWFGASPTMQKEARADLVRETLRLSDALLTTGSPNDWQTQLSTALSPPPPATSNPSDVQAAINSIKQVGLMASLEENELDKDKLNNLKLFLETDFDVNYLKLKQKLNFAYDFNVTIEANNVFYDCVGKCGVRASPNPQELVETTRVITMDDDLARLKINAWYN